MLGKLLLEQARRGGERTALFHGAREYRYGELAAIATSLAERRWSDLAARRVALAVVEPERFIPSVAALDLLGAHVFLLGSRPTEEISRLQQAFGWNTVLQDDDVPDRTGIDVESLSATTAGRGTVTILTSGTTGVPKAVNHTWASLAAPTRRDDRQAEARWLCAYPLQLYAGTQVLLQALVNAAAVVVPESLDPGAIANVLVDRQITHASGTPTFWRQLFFFGGRRLLRRAGLRQITLGGEAVTQDLLDLARSVFPRARIVHIYASTELGRLFSVTDGREGFPSAFLDAVPGGGADLRIVDGELHARSQNAMLGYEGPAAPSAGRGEWFATGDLVELRDDRVLFRGRSGDIINVGGQKVTPLRVETVLRTVAGVADLRVYPQKSSLAGQLVAADVVLTPDAEEDQVRRALHQAARHGLESHEAPRIVRFVREIERSDAFKIRRRETDA